MIASQVMGRAAYTAEALAHTQQFHCALVQAVQPLHRGAQHMRPNHVQGATEPTTATAVACTTARGKILPY